MNTTENEYVKSLKPVSQSIRHESQTVGRFYHYEPGNGTRYEVFISFRGRMTTGDHYPQLVVSIMNFDRPCSMTIPMFDGYIDAHPDYVCEKMRVLPGDALAIVELVKHFLATAVHGEK